MIYVFSASLYLVQMIRRYLNGKTRSVALYVDSIPVSPLPQSLFYPLTCIMLIWGICDLLLLFFALLMHVLNYRFLQFIMLLCNMFIVNACI